MLLYEETGVKFGTFINLTQNVRTGRPPNALPSSTQSYCYSTTCYTAECFQCIVLCKLQRTWLRWWRHRSRWFLYITVSYLDQFQLHFLHRFSYFSTKAEPQFLTGVFLTTGLNSMADGISYKNPKYTADRISKHGMAPLRRVCKCMSTKQKLH